MTWRLCIKWSHIDFLPSLGPEVGGKVTRWLGTGDQDRNSTSSRRNW